MMQRVLGVAIRRAGAPGGVRFTERQLYYELCRVLQPLHAAPRRPGFVLPPPVSYARYLAALRRLRRPPDLVTARPTRPGSTVPPEVFDYGLPRLLVCQHPDIATMLRANELHLESACPVYAAADLPLGAGPAAALRRAEDPTVYVLHDASAAGFATVAEVRAWTGEVPVRALGLRPVHAAALHLVATRGPAPPAPPELDGLEPWERRWLASGRVAEVAAVPPARLLRTVHRLVREQARRRRRRPRVRRIQAAGFLSWPSAEEGRAP